MHGGSSEAVLPGKRPCDTARTLCLSGSIPVSNRAGGSETGLAQQRDLLPPRVALRLDDHVVRAARHVPAPVIAPVPGARVDACRKRAACEGAHERPSGIVNPP